MSIYACAFARAWVHVYMMRLAPTSPHPCRSPRTVWPVLCSMDSPAGRSSLADILIDLGEFNLEVEQYEASLAEFGEGYLPSAYLGGYLVFVTSPAKPVLLP